MFVVRYGAVANTPKDEPTIWFTSDLHLGDHQVLSYGTRPYKNVREMNRALLAGWEQVVAPDDEVWILGDLARGSRLDHMLDLVAALPGRKHLVTGNHDRCWPFRSSYGEAEVARYARAGFESLTTETTMDIAGETVRLSHFPYAPRSVLEAGRRTAKPIDDGGWLLHGHVHRAWLQKRRQICVAVDAWRFAPVNIETIELLITAGPNNLPALPALAA